MKMKKLLAAAVALAMVAALVPGLAVTASAEGNLRYDDLTMEDWHAFAGDPVFTYPATGKGDAPIKDYYTGWSSSWTANDQNGTNINSYWNCYQVYGGGKSDTLKMPGYGVGKKFVIMEFWHTRSLKDFKHEFAIKDTDGKIIETGYVRRGGTSDITDGFASGKTDNFTSPEPADAATTGVNAPVKISTAYETGTRIVFVNNDDNTYSVIYYLANGSKGNSSESQINEDTYHNKYQLVWTDNEWKKMYTATYKGQFNGIGSIDYAVTSTTDWGNKHRVNFLRIYSGDVEKKNYTVTITGAGENNNEYTVQAVRAADIPVPSFDGYVLKTRAAGDSKINSTKSNTLTLTYEKNIESLGSWAVRNNVTGSTAFNNMKILGSHDSFTDKMAGTKEYADDAGVLYGDSGATGANSAPSTALGKSKAQSADVLSQLNAGVRYFDVRLSRMGKNDGTLWTRHGLISEDFEGIAYTIAQFAKENPGEIIILDFQSTYDAMYTETRIRTAGNNGGGKGDDNEGVYAAIWSLLKKTGVADYLVGNVNLSTSYDSLTNNGTKAAILCFAKSRGANCVGQFIDRNVINGVYCEPSTSFVGVSYSDVVKYINDNYNKGASFQIIHAFTTPSVLSRNTLISDAQTNNPKFIQEQNFQSWMEKSNIIILDDVINEAPAYLAKLAEYTRDGFDGAYTATVEGVTVEGPTASVPFSTKLTAEKNGNDYTFKLTQFENMAADLTGPVKLTFPDATGGTSGLKTVVYCDGKEVGTANGDGSVTVSNVTDLSKPFTVTTEAASGAAEAKLGYNGTNLTLDFLLGGLIDGVDAESFKVAVTNQDGQKVGETSVTKSAPNVLLTPKDSNAIYTAVIEAVKDGTNYTVGSISASLYSEVVENLENVEYTGENAPNRDMIAKANSVITHGGVYYDGNADTLNAETKKIVEVTETDGKITVTVKEPYKDYGIGFILSGGKICVGSEDRTITDADADKVYDSFTVDKTGGTVTLSNEAEVVTLSLDAVNIELAETLAGEIEADGADARYSLVPEI